MGQPHDFVLFVGIPAGIAIAILTTAGYYFKKRHGRRREPP